MNGYPIAAEALDLEVYLLASLIAGSHALFDVERDYPGLRWARTTFEFSEISRRLIGLAVMLRTQLEVSHRRPDAIVGTLMTDVSRPSDRANLSLREACNKIIHAKSVSLAASLESQPSESYVSRTVLLEGTHNNRGWRAELDTLSFLNAVCHEF